MAVPHTDERLRDFESEARARLPLMLALVACCLVAVVVRFQPPAPRPAGAPATEFSAGRARRVLARLLGQGQPHPLGSAAAAEVRRRIVATLTDLPRQSPPPAR